VSLARVLQQTGRAAEAIAELKEIASIFEGEAGCDVDEARQLLNSLGLPGESPGWPRRWCPRGIPEACGSSHSLSDQMCGVCDDSARSPRLPLNPWAGARSGARKTGPCSRRSEPSSCGSTGRRTSPPAGVREGWSRSWPAVATGSRTSPSCSITYASSSTDKTKGDTWISETFKARGFYETSFSRSGAWKYFRRAGGTAADCHRARRQRAGPSVSPVRPVAGRRKLLQPFDDLHVVVNGNARCPVAHVPERRELRTIDRTKLVPVVASVQEKVRPKAMTREELDDAVTSRAHRARAAARQSAVSWSSTRRSLTQVGAAWALPAW